MACLTLSPAKSPGAVVCSAALQRSLDPCEPPGACAGDHVTHNQRSPPLPLCASLSSMAPKPRARRVYICAACASSFAPLQLAASCSAVIGLRRAYSQTATPAPALLWLGSWIVLGPTMARHVLAARVHRVPLLLAVVLLLLAATSDGIRPSPGKFNCTM
jgi:hypothetical protein